MKKNTVEISLTPFQKFDEDEKKAVEAEAHRYGEFVGIPVKTLW